MSFSDFVSTMMKKEDTFEDKVARIMKRELLRSHRAQPVVVESLLLASQVESRSAQNDNALSGKLIINLCKFQQKMNWLCPWGKELVDETNRPPGFELPKEVRDKYFAIKRKEIMDENFLKRHEFIEILKEYDPLLDRILIGDDYDPKSFQLLRYHPFEELHTKFFYTLSLSDIENITRCTTLRNINIGCSKVSLKHIREFQKLPHLEKLYYCHDYEGTAPITRIRDFPNLTLIPIQQNGLRYADRQVRKIVRLLKDMHERVHHLYLAWVPIPEISIALGRCTGVKSIFLEAAQIVDYKDVEKLFDSPNIHRSLQSIHINFTALGFEVYDLLSECTNLRWIHFQSDNEATEDDFIPIIKANKAHLIELNIVSCPHVYDEILEAIAICSGLKRVQLVHTGVSAEAVSKYREERRPNWQAIEFVQNVRPVLENSREQNTDDSSLVSSIEESTEGEFE